MKNNVTCLKIKALVKNKVSIIRSQKEFDKKKHGSKIKVFCTMAERDKHFRLYFFNIQKIKSEILPKISDFIFFKY